MCAKHFVERILYYIPIIIISVHAEVTTISNIEADCQPSTHIDLGCNTCFCDNAGRIDNQWCTKDDCSVNKTQKAPDPATQGTKDCAPGSVYRNSCNICMCPHNGSVTDNICTRSTCTATLPDVKLNLTCSPMSYYSVGCNICRCPNDGVKNTAFCTRRVCDNALRSEIKCTPGEFLADGCAVCVCPPSGLRAEKVCTSVICETHQTSLGIIHQAPEGSRQSSTDRQRKIIACYPGEVFKDGCRICACSDLGLRSFAECNTAACEVIKRRSALGESACRAGSRVLDGCNWCTCDHYGRYQCTGSRCEVADVFGHFDDAIREISVGMEGRGAWRRSREDACEPDVLYQRKDISCVCNADGSWPVAACEETFRNLVGVKLTPMTDVADLRQAQNTCDRELLYIVGCDVCVCPSEGVLRSTACTRRKCDLTFDRKFKELQEESKKMVKGVHTVNAICTLGEKHKISCSECLCVANNQLSCNNDGCLDDVAVSGLKSSASKEEVNMYSDNTDNNENDFMPITSVNEMEEPLENGNQQDLDRSPKYLQSNPEMKSLKNQQFQCQPGSSVSFDCNRCYCSLDGQITGCSNNTCDEFSNENVLGMHIIPVPTLINIDKTGELVRYPLMNMDPMSLAQKESERSNLEPYLSKRLSIPLPAVPEAIRQNQDNTLKTASQISLPFNAASRSVDNGNHPHNSYNAESLVKSYLEKISNMESPVQKFPANVRKGKTFDEEYIKSILESMYSKSQKKLKNVGSKAKKNPRVKLNINSAGQKHTDNYPISIPDLSHMGSSLSKAPLYSSKNKYKFNLLKENANNKKNNLNKFNMGSLVHSHNLLNGKDSRFGGPYSHKKKVYHESYHPSHVFNTGHSWKEYQKELVDIIPIKAPNKKKCTPGSSYTVECNYCFCLSNGNSLCTLMNC